VHARRPRDPEQDDRALQFRLKNIERCVPAEQPKDTVMLRSDPLTPAQIAEVVLAAVSE
jgi:hypothetical protein